MTVYERLLSKVEQVSDINCHLFTLSGYARESDHITELGVRDVVSTWAFLDAKPRKLVCVDIVRSPNIDEAIQLAMLQGTDLEFLQRDTTDDSFVLDETDFLFIDTMHTYSQLSRELKLHGNKARKYIAFHDTNTYGMRDENQSPYSMVTWGPRGLLPAIVEFVNANPHWMLANRFEHNNGLTILRRN
jgi:hypothetical protein